MASKKRKRARLIRRTGTKGPDKNGSSEVVVVGKKLLFDLIDLTGGLDRLLVIPRFWGRAHLEAIGGDFLKWLGKLP